LEHQLAGDTGNNLLLTLTPTLPILKLKLTLTTFDSPTKISKTVYLSDSTRDYCTLFGVNDLYSVIVQRSVGCLYAFFEAV